MISYNNGAYHSAAFALKFMSVNKNVPTWNLVGWCYMRLLISGHVRKSMLTNMNFDISFSQQLRSPAAFCGNLRRLCVFIYRVSLSLPTFIISHLTHSDLKNTRPFIDKLSKFIM